MDGVALFDPPYASALASRLQISFTPTLTSSTFPSPKASPGSTAQVPKPTASPNVPSLSPGATAGISLGATFGALLLAIVGFSLQIAKTLEITRERGRG
jgi:hypothetical protein